MKIEGVVTAMISEYPFKYQTKYQYPGSSPWLAAVLAYFPEMFPFVFMFNIVVLCKLFGCPPPPAPFIWNWNPSVNVGSECFGHLRILNIFRWQKSLKVESNPFYLYLMVFSKKD